MKLTQFRLWDILGGGEVTSVAKLAAECFERNGRPLRIVVDEAAWRFNNLIAEQTATIRVGESIRLMIVLCNERRLTKKQ